MEHAHRDHAEQHRHRTARAVIVLSVLSVLSGCGRNEGAGGPTDAGDAGPRDGDGDAMQPPSHSDVTGRRYEICRQVPADVEMPIDLSTTLVQLIIPDDSRAGYRVMNGTGGSDGRFRFADVPDGITFFLRLDNIYYATTDHAIDIVSERARRCLPVPVTTDDPVPPATLRYDLTNLTPVIHGGVLAFERLELMSIALQYTSSGAGPLNPGDTSAAGVASWAGHFFPVPLVDAAAGDDLHVFHVRSGSFMDPASQRRRGITRIIDSLDASGVSLAQGGEIPLSGALQPAPEHALTFSIDPRRFDADAGGDSIPAWLTVQLFARPGPVTTAGAVLLDLDLSDRSHGESPAQTVSALAYGDPFPASWKRPIHIDYASRRRAGFNNPVTVHNEQLVEFTGEIDMSSALKPPSGVTVGGVELVRGGKLDFDGEAPVDMRWNPVPGATAYRLSIHDLEFTVDYAPNPIATFWTADTTLRVPASVFAAGAFPGYHALRPGIYVFVLDAVQSPIDLRRGHAMAETPSDEVHVQAIRLPAPIRIAGTSSGRFHFLAHCGDGRVQLADGEDCDTRGQSATCNADCTLAVCGDGVFNPAADEDCDSGDASFACNANCTVSRCGDGHLNWPIEDCDDGNALDDGNGCSARCRFNNQCGNGIIEDVAEACDPGPAQDTATCDVDCTPAICGDGYVNMAAGEECDEPFFPLHCAECRRR